jgi:hypothetical protein
MIAHLGIHTPAMHAPIVKKQNKKNAIQNRISTHLYWETHWVEQTS